VLTVPLESGISPTRNAFRLTMKSRTPPQVSNGHTMDHF
jgi:hypothetical protein